MNEWKWYTVTAELSWACGDELCSAALKMKIHAKSVRHAIGRMKERVEKMGVCEVSDIDARLFARRAAGVSQ